MKLNTEHSKDTNHQGEVANSLENLLEFNGGADGYKLIGGDFNYSELENWRKENQHYYIKS